MVPSAPSPPLASPSASPAPSSAPKGTHPPSNVPRPAFAGPPSGPEPPFPIRLSGPIIKGFGRGSKELGIPTANIPISGLSVGGHEDVESGVYFGFAGVDIDDTGRILGGDRDGNDVSLATTGETQQENLSENEKDVLSRNGDASESANSPKTQPHLNPTTNPTTTTTTTPQTQKRGNIYPMVMSIGWNPFYKNTVRSVEVHILPPQPFEVDFYGARMNLLILGFIRPEYDYVSAESLIRDIRVDIEVARRSLEREGWREWGQEEGGLLEGL